MRVGIALSLFLLVSPAAASFNNGNKVLEQCQGGTDFHNGYCLGVVAGLADAISASHGQQICVPNTATLGQIRDVLIQFLRQYPDIRHQPAGLLAYAALLTAFPCRR